MAFIDSIRLGYGHNLIVGNTTPTAILEKLSENSNRTIESFGLFDSGPAPESYAPGTNAETVAPKPGDFITPVYRALSEVIVHKNWNPVDFSMNGILQKSKGMLVGQTLYKNHVAEVGNEVGSVESVAWENAAKDPKTGIMIPAGINAKMKVDAASNPKLARGILMDPPSVHSTSVTVMFMWDKSHAALTEQEFWNQLGTMDKDGNMVRRIATSIKKYNELSFVSHGADPYAQKKTADGSIVNPRHADASYNSEKRIEAKQKDKYFFYDFQTDLIANGEENTIPEEFNSTDTTNKNNTEMNKYLLLLAATMGINIPADATEESLSASINAAALALKTAAPAISAEEVTRLKGIENQMAPLQAKLTAFETAANASLTASRTKVLALYNKAANGKPVEAIATLINNATADQLPALETQYTIQLEEAFPMTCKSCGGHNVSRASAIPGLTEGTSEGGTTTELSAEEAMQKLRDKAKAQSSSTFFDSDKPKAK